MRSFSRQIWKNIIHVAERPFVQGVLHSCRQSGNHKCPYCNADQASKTEEEDNEDLMKRVAVNDTVSICMLAGSYHHGLNGFQQDHAKAKELYTRAADLGCNDAHSSLGNIYHDAGDMKKTKFHWEAAAMAGNEVARYNIGCLEFKSGNIERAVKHWLDDCGISWGI
jgi:TPR repeat protein